MDDNARAHRACITDQYLQQATIVRMEWPATSSDLNPIEHCSNQFCNKNENCKKLLQNSLR